MTPRALTSLDNVADFINGDRSHRYPSESEYVSDGIPFLSATDIHDGGVSAGAARRIPRAVYDRLSGGKVRNGDVLFCLRGSLGKTARVQGLAEAAIASSLVLVRAKPITDPRFLYYLMQSADVQGRLGGLDNGSVQANLSVREMSRIAVPEVPLDEQRAIAHILGTLDDKIELNRRMGETLRSMASVLFKSWFIDFSPVWAKSRGMPSGLPAVLDEIFPASFENSEVGEMPSGWKVVGLDGIGRFLNGLALQKFPPTDGRSLPVVKIAQLRSGNTVGADRASANLDGDYVVEDGDILFSWSGSLECVLWAGGRGALNQHLFKVTSERFPKWLLYLAIHHHLEEFRRIAAAKATTMGHIQRHHLSGAKIALPPEPILREMDGMLSPILDRMLNCSVNSRSLADARDVLLPGLISGGVSLAALTQGLEAPQ